MKPMIPHQVRLLGPNLWVGRSATSSVKRGRRIMRSPAPDGASCSFGQNQAVSAIAHGTSPNATAQGEKIEAMKTTPTAQAAMNGHRLGSRHRLAKVGRRRDDGRQQHFLLDRREGR